MVAPKNPAAAVLAGKPAMGPSASANRMPPSVVKYIREQEKHHRRVTFQEESISFLNKNGVPYDERYIWE